MTRSSSHGPRSTSSWAKTSTVRKTKPTADGSDGVLGAGSAALRKIMGREQKVASSSAPGDQGALAEMLADDPINAVIESEIIPRLFMASLGSDSRANPASQTTPEPSQLSVHSSGFASLALDLDAADLLEHVEHLLKNGVGFDAICVDVLAPTARALGDMWVSDECDFVDVTMGLWRLQEVMRALSARVPVKKSGDVIASTALFLPMPGDTHAFGAQMIDEVFSKGGWLSEVIVKPTRREALDRLSRTPFDLVGVTITCDCSVSAIANLIKTMRKVSANPHLVVIIGGNMVNAHPEIVDDLGADGTAKDASEALKLAGTLIERSPSKAVSLR